MGKKNRNNDKKKKNAMAPSTSNPTISAPSAPPIQGGGAKKEKAKAVAPSTSNPTVSAAPPVQGGGGKAKEKKQESPAAAAVSTSRERKSSQEAEMQVGTGPLSWLSPSTMTRPGLMFATRLDSEDSNPELNRTRVIVFSDKMKQALSLTQEIKNIPYIRVFAKDIESRVYELHFSRNHDVELDTEFILYHQWGRLLADNALKEGYSVAGYGYDNFTGGYFNVVLFFQEKLPPAPENQELEVEAAAPAAPASIFLFEKKVDGDDLDQVAIECCSDKMKMALLQIPWRPYIRVFATDPKRNRYDMTFGRHTGEGGSLLLTLSNGWEDFVAENGVEEGDIVTGTGKVTNHAITMRLHLFKNVVQIGIAILFFEKTLEPADTDALVGRLVVRICKDVVKDLVDEKHEAEGNDGYVRVFTQDAEWRRYELRLSRLVPQEGEEGDVYVVDHQWGDVVTDNGLKSGDRVWCWGSFIEDGSFQAKIDVDKALEL